MLQQGTVNFFRESRPVFYVDKLVNIAKRPDVGPRREEMHHAPTTEDYNNFMRNMANKELNFSDAVKFPVLATRDLIKGAIKLPVLTARKTLGLAARGALLPFEVTGKVARTAVVGGSKIAIGTVTGVAGAALAVPRYAVDVSLGVPARIILSVADGVGTAVGYPNQVNRKIREKSITKIDNVDNVISMQAWKAKKTLLGKIDGPAANDNTERLAA